MLTKEVSAAAKLSSSHASAQLRQLKEKGYVRELHLREEKRGRYEVADRFYNIYYVLRFSRTERERLARLVGFLHDLFGATAMRSLYPTTLDAIRTRDMLAAEAADWLVVLADHVGRDTEYSKRHQWWAKAVDLMFEKGMDLDALDQVDAAFVAGGPLRKELSVTRRALKLAHQGDWSDAESAFRTHVEKSPDSMYGWIGLAMFTDDPDSLNRAIIAFRQWSAGAKKDSLFTSNAAGAWLISFAECQALLKLDRGQEAADVICGSLDLIDRDGPPESLQTQATALLNCGQKLVETGLGKRVLPLFVWVAELAQPSYPWKVRLMSARALLLKVIVHACAEETEELRAATQETLRLVGTNDPPELKTTAICALSATASWFAAIGQANETMGYLKLISHYVRPAVQDDQRKKSAQLLTLAALGSSAGGVIKPKLSESICRTATDMDPTCAAAWRGLAAALLAGGSKTRHAKASDALERSLSAEEGVSDEALGSLAGILNNDARRRPRRQSEAPHGKRRPIRKA